MNRAAGVRASRRAPPVLVGVALASALWLSGCAGSRALDPRTARFPDVSFRPPPVAQSALSGGAPVFLLPDRDLPLVRLYASFRGGSLYDPPDRAGLAEVAALAWRTGGAGALTPEAFDEALEERAIELRLGFGRDTGWVTFSALPADLDRGLELLAALLAEPAFREERVTWAAGQMAERLRREVDSPQDLAFRELRRALYPGHPRGLIPTAATVGRVVREDLLALHRRVVSEGAWAFGAVGDFEPQDLLARLEERFGSLPSRGEGFAPVPPPAEPPPRTVLVPRPLPQTTLVWARLGPSRTAPEFHALDVADHVLGSGGFQSLLVREIRSNRGLAYSVGSFYQALPTFGVLGMTASTRAESAPQVLELLATIPREAATSGLPAHHVAQAREALVNRHVFRYEDPAALVRERLGLLFDGLPADLPARYVAGVQAVTAPGASAAAEAFDLAAGVLVVVGDVDPADPAWGSRGPVLVVTAD
ncbi:MAG: pitrilysin family protein [Thermodesulfobacteriota bacterium]